MFDLEKHEKIIILVLLTVLLAGIFLSLHKASSQITDVKIRSFYYETDPKSPERININEADEKTLSRLDRIGPSLAKRIVAYREKKGSFMATEEIKNVKGIGDKLYESIKDEISVK